jgi:glutathione S-transferase
MKLYYVPASCSLATHIVLREIGMEFDLERYDPAKGQTEKGTTFAGVNAKARVPALEFDNGEILTEGAALVQYLVSQTPDQELALPTELMERARVQEGLSFVVSELHKAFNPFFAADTDDAAKERAHSLVVRHLDYLEEAFSDDRRFFVGNKFSIADIYLFVVLRWTGVTGEDISKWKNLSAFQGRMNARAHVQAALEAEGLLEAA